MSGIGQGHNARVVPSPSSGDLLKRTKQLIQPIHIDVTTPSTITTSTHIL